MIGATNNNGNGVGRYAFSGELAEVVMYNGTVCGSNSGTNRAKIESYLAAKYGITLSQTTAQNYLNSSGTIYWNGSTNSGYNKNLTIIGRDDASALNQKQSKSINQGTTG